HSPGAAVQPRCARDFQAALIPRLWIRLRSHLDIGDEPELVVDRMEDEREIGAGEEGRRAPAEEHGLYGRGGAQHLCSEADLVNHGLGVRLPAYARCEL